MNAAPRVTIGVPVYNGELYLQTALDALSAQDFDSMEIVISDNASTDGTEEICRDAASLEPRIRYVRHAENRGGVWNVNHLIDLARGREFKWAYYDDVCAPTFVQACTEAMDAAPPDTVMAHTRVVTIDGDGAVVEERQDEDLGLYEGLAHERVYNLLSKLANQTEFALMRLDAVRRTRQIQPFIGSELFFLTEMCMLGRFVQVPDQLLMLRRHEDQYGRDRFSEATWYAGAGKPQSVLPWTKINVVLLRTVLGSDLPAAERARCASAVVRGWTWPRKRSIASDFKNLPKTVARRRAASGARPDS